MAGGEFVAHAHAAVQLDRLLGDGAAGAADLRPWPPTPRACARAAPPTAPSPRRAAPSTATARMDEHVHRAVLQRLEAADRLAELLARLQILERRAFSASIAPTASAHSAAAPKSAARSSAAKRRLAAPSSASAPTCTSSSSISAARRPSMVRSRAPHAARLRVDEEQADAPAHRAPARGARRDDQLVGLRAVQHHRLVAVQHDSPRRRAWPSSRRVQLVARVRLAVARRRAAACPRRRAAGCLLLRLAPGESTRPPPSTTVERYGSTTRPRPSSVITSRCRPRRRRSRRAPRRTARRAGPSRRTAPTPRRDQPFSDAMIACRASKPYSLRDEFRERSRSCCCSSLKVKSMVRAPAPSAR